MVTLYYPTLEENYSYGLITYEQYRCYKSFKNIWDKQDNNKGGK